MLVFTYSAGFRHSYIPTAVEVIVKMGERSGLFEAVATEECEDLQPQKLSDYSVMIFLTSGEIPLCVEQRKSPDKVRGR